MGPLSCPVCLSVYNVGILWLNGWTDQDETWHADRPRPRPHCVRWGPSSTKRGHSPPSNFRPMSIVAKRLDRSRCHLVGGRPRPIGDIVLDGDPAPPKRGTALPNFRPTYGQTAGWIKMPLRMEVGIGPDDIVLDRGPASPFPKKGHVPQFSAHVYCGQTVAHLSYCWAFVL